MSRYIDAEWLKAFFEADKGKDRMTPIDSLLALIDDAPSIDAVSVVHGEWKRRLVDNGFNADWVCSECGYRVKTDFVNYNYCPSCGAQMKGADDETN